MLTLFLSLLSSSGFGSIIGLGGGLINRWADYKFKQQDREFELLKMDKDREFMKDEYASRIQISTVEADASIEKAGYEAMTESYQYARTSKEDGFVDSLSKLVRPLITFLFFLFSVYVFWKIDSIVRQAGIIMNTTEVLAIWKGCIEWILFQAGISLGWWFAMRPGRTPTFGGK